MVGITEVFTVVIVIIIIIIISLLIIIISFLLESNLSWTKNPGFHFGATIHSPTSNAFIQEILNFAQNRNPVIVGTCLPVHCYSPVFRTGPRILQVLRN